MKKKATMFLTILCICLGSIFLHSRPVQAAPWIHLEVTPNTQNKVTLTWDKKKVTRYVIYRGEFKDSFSSAEAKMKKITVLSGSKKSYVDRKVKKNTWYKYKIKAYKKSGKSYKLVYEGEDWNFTGWNAPEWDEYLRAESPKAIYLSCIVRNSLKIDGYEVYRRKQGEKTYKKIATRKTKKNEYSYTDRKVSPGVWYEYKIRTYHKKGKKKGYSKYAHLSVRAIDRYGVYKVRVLTKETENLSSLDLELTSKIENADLYFDDWFYYGDSLDDESGGALKISEYSADGKTWKKAPNKVVLKSNKKIYLRLKDVDNKRTFSLKDVETLYCETCQYHFWNGGSFTIDLKKKQGEFNHYTP